MNRTNSERVGPGPYELRAQADHIEGSGYPLAGTAQLLREVADYVEGLQAELRRYDEGVSAVLNGLTTPDLFFQEAHEAARTRGTT